MNGSMIRYILGWVLKIEAALMLLPVLVAAVYGEKAGLIYLALSIGCFLIGFLMSLKPPKNTVFHLKEGCFATALSWIFLSVFGALPFIITKEIPKFIDALFETVSGFTTTGASVLSQLGHFTHCSLFWRSFTHWIGGMGVLVFLLAIVPLSGGSHINLMRAESPGPSVGKLVPKLRQTALLLYVIYLGMTVLEFVLLVCGNLNVFESMLTALGTAGTGGFWINDTPMGVYCSPYTQWVIAVFMILFGVNFNAYYFMLFRKFRKAFGMEEVRCYFIVIGVAVAILTGVNTIHNIEGFSSVSEGLRLSVFQVGAVITTSGFSTTDFDAWPEISRVLMVLLMFSGACAGSTGGGIKISRIMIAIKGIFKEMLSYIHPKSVRKIKMEGKPVDHEVVRSVNVYLITFAALYIVSLLLISIEGKGLVTSFTSVIATINNIGPGLEKVGPTCNYGHFSVLSKSVMIFDMLAGRLELFPMLILFHPTAWREMFRTSFHKRRKA
ncbi:MAG: TrkH family potassium uptake protein [Clostridia bacterium]|nr:TrkH family potassium uptake protein [Clostridia bacterium]